MKFPLSWLKELVPVELPAAELAHILTMAGVETEVAERVGEDWERVFIGQVLDLGRHEQSDNLSIAKVQGPDGEVTIVTAAKNLVVGAKVPLILAGGALGENRIEKRRLVGVESDGMVCSGDELGISPNRDGIYLLEDDAPVGAVLAEYLNDVVLEAFVTPNRPDCLSVHGIAREVAALTGVNLPALRIAAPPVINAEAPYSLEVRDPDICPRYTLAMVSELQVKPSPLWLQRRLFFSGVRPISNVVDVTNYVMLEMGQPLHAFDRDKLEGGIIVRRATVGERMKTLDGVERELGPDMLVIADHARAVGVAGVMGGETSEVSDSTTRVALESATFDPSNIRRTARDLRLSSEASRRFERGLDPALAPRASDRAVQLFREVADGSPVSPLQDIYPTPESPIVIRLTPEHVSSVMGRDYSVGEITSTLSSLGFGVQPRADALDITAPSFRRDIAGVHDLVEEVARVTGYDSIPETLPSGRLPAPRVDPSLSLQERVKSVLIGAGAQEIISYSLVDPASHSKIDSRAAWPAASETSPLIRVWNPMSADHSALRQSLLPSILTTVWENLRHEDRVALFEVAKVYLPSNEILPIEPHRLSVALAGRRYPHGWATDDAKFDFFDLKGVIEALGQVLHIELRYRPSDHATYHPGRCAEVVVVSGASEESVGYLGQIHPTVAERFDLDEEVFAAEIHLDVLVQHARDLPRVVAPARYPGVELDLAVVVAEDVTQESILAAIRESGGELLAEVTLFDVYRGEPIPEGSKSLAFSLTFRAQDRTLTDAEGVEARAAIESHLGISVGAQIRGR